MFVHIVDMIYHELKAIIIMTKEEAKKIAEAMMAYAEGKNIEFSRWGAEDWQPCDNPSFQFGSYRYRVQPEPKYRPFQNVEECWEEMKKHEPFGWLTNDSDTYFMMDFVGDTDISIPNAAIIGFDKALNLGQKFADGTPFGVKEED